VLGIEHREPPRRLECERVALEQCGAVLLADVPPPVRCVFRRTLRGNRARRARRMLQMCVHGIDAGLFDG